VGKNNSTTFSPLENFWKNALVAPPGKILPAPLCLTYAQNVPGKIGEANPAGYTMGKRSRS